MKRFIKGFGLAIIAATNVQAQVVFTNTFDGALPAEIQPGAAIVEGVQGYAGLGPAGNQFGGSFLRSPTGNLVSLSVSNLPPHVTLSLSMLFAAIDSLDGTGQFPSGDFFTVTLDGAVVFRESFANALPEQMQSYVPPPGAELARRIDLGFAGPGSYYTDSAYNFAVDPRFQYLSHTRSDAVFTFQIEGPGIQSFDDESWAMDNFAVTFTGWPLPVIQAINLVDAGAVITWASASNFVYHVQTTTNLANPVWTDLAPPVTATNVTASYLHPGSDGSRFYRVKLMLP